MSGWAIFWWIVVAAALFLYFGLGLVIAVGGFFDVRKMFARLRAAHAGDGTGPSERSE